jgi:hypothetical protein
MHAPCSTFPQCTELTGAARRNAGAGRKDHMLVHCSTQMHDGDHPTTTRRRVRTPSLRVRTYYLSFFALGPGAEAITLRLHGGAGGEGGDERCGGGTGGQRGNTFGTHCGANSNIIETGEQTACLHGTQRTSQLVQVASSCPEPGQASCAG